MPSKSQPPTQSKPGKAKHTAVKLDTATFSQPPSSTQKRFDPLTAYKNLRNHSASPAPVLRGPPVEKRKGKEKSVEIPVDDDDLAEGQTHGDRLWVDIYEPTTEAELAVHVRKVEDVRRWFTEAFEGGPSGKMRRYRRILALTGPSGIGKTATVRVLAREMGFSILEWRNATGERSTTSWNSLSEFDGDYESTFSKFEAFLNRAMSCRSIFSEPSTSKSSSPSSVPPKHIILLEDLPNILHPEIQAQFHSVLRAFVESAPQSITPVPIVIIISDATMRGETRDELLTSGGGAGFSWSREKSDILDIRTVLPRDLLGGPYVTQIAFNPIAPTLMKKALTGLVGRHFSARSRLVVPTQGMIDTVIESANGDIRSAIMALQFSSIAIKKSGKKKRASESTVLMEAMTRRESSLALFHLIGKVLYNKRKGDPPNTSATAKDVKKERELDVKIKDPPKLPAHLKEHQRRGSRVDVDMLYADSPIDSSLFSLYIQQNYTQFCDELDQCQGIIDCLSWVDSSGGEMWYQVNPHRFHLLTLGTLHSLPSPVPRRSQKVYKPEYFEYLAKEKEAREAVDDTRHWMLVHRGLGSDESLTTETSRWGKLEVALELGAVLRLKQEADGRARLGNEGFPASHSLFSRLAFTKSGMPGGQQVDEDVIGDEEQSHFEEDEVNTGRIKGADDADGGWLEDDEIEEF